MSLEPGFYKIRMKDGLLQSAHYLHIFKDKGAKFFQIDHGVPCPWKQAEDALEGVEVVKRYVDHNGPKIQRARIVVEAQDEDGDEMRFPASDVFVLRDIFKFLPPVARALKANLKRVMRR